jgi:Zn-finger nucleic acid-binding protein
MTIIGISGYARSGKDLFTSVAQKVLKEHEITSEKFALAYELKNDLKSLIKTKIGIDVFTDDTQSKSIIRPLLVAYGDVMRKTSEGKYWTTKVSQRIDKSKADVVFITDIRYDVYPEDECTWLDRKMSGKLIHITKFKQSTVPQGKRFSKNKIVKIYDAAPNDHELLNNPKVKSKANYAFEWEDYSDKLNDTSLEDHPYIIEKVIEALKAINVI